MRTVRRRIMPVVTVVAALAVAFGSAEASTATSTVGPPALDTSVRAVMERQAALSALAADLDRAGEDDPGFAATGIDAATNSVIVYRVGGAGAPTLTAGLSTGSTRVVHRPALLTRAQTEELMGAVSAATDALAAEGIEVTGTRTTWSGPVVIGVRTLTPAAAALAQRFARFGAGTVTVEQDEGAVPIGRLDGGPPYYGGGRIKSAGGEEYGNACTSGFGAVSPSGVRYILTAFHCVNIRDKRFWDGGNDLMGSVTNQNPARDIAAIKVASAHYVWAGPWNVKPRVWWRVG